MKYQIEVIYDSQNAEELEEAQDFLDMLQEFVDSHDDFFLKSYDMYNIDEDDKEDLEERFGDDLTTPMVVINDDPIFPDYIPTEQEFRDQVESIIEEAEFD